MVTRRPRKPSIKRGLRDIRPRWRKSASAWWWQPHFRVGSRTITGRSYPTQEEAGKAAAEMRGVSQIVAEVGGTTLADAYEATVDALLANGGSEVTARGYRQKFRKWGEILNDAVPVLEFRPGDVQHWKIERRRLHGVDSNTIRGDMRILQRVFKCGGVPDDSNPVRACERPKETEPERFSFTMEQIADIRSRMLDPTWKSRGCESEFHADLLIFLTSTGARNYELSRFRATDVDWNGDGGGTIKLRQVKGKRRVRKIPFPAEASDLVRRLSERCVSGRMLDPSSLSTVFTRWQRRLSEPHLTARNLRRSFATDLQEHATLRQIQAMLGHSHLTTTQRYLDVAEEPSRAAVASLHRRLIGG